MDKLTVEVAREMFPTKLKSSITQEVVDTINNISVEPEVANFYRDNLMTYTSVLSEGKYRVSDYIKAIKYVTYKFMGDTNRAAYTKTFPERMQRMIDNGSSDKHINSFITAYNKGSMVVKIFEKNVIPTSIMYQDLYHQAVMTNAELMTEAKSEMVRHKAATTLMEQLTPDPASKIELDVNMKQESSIVDKYHDALLGFSKQLQEKMKDGGDINQINNIKINTNLTDVIDVEAEKTDG